MQDITRWTIRLLLALAVVAALPAAADAQQDQERIALAWIEAHNAADVAAMAGFRAEHFKRSEVSDWQDSYRDLIDKFGTLDVYGVMINGDGEMMIGVKPERGPDRMRVVFSFFDDAPDQIRQVGLDVGDAEDDGRGGGGSRLPALELAGGWKRRTPTLDAYLRDLAKQGLFAGAVLVSERGEVRFEGAYGLASREFAVPNDLDTRFDVGSCNKDYTRVAIMQLVAQGKLSLADTVGKHLPDYPNEVVRERVTLQHLLDHRAGLPDYFDEDWRRTPMSQLRHIEDYIPIWGPKPLLSEPGVRERYSNFGYTVLGAVIEAVSGERYPDYVVEHVFEPAGMTRSGFFETDAVVPNVAVGYTHMSRTGRLDEAVKNIYVEPAKGGPWGKSYSTVRDLYRYYDAMMNGRLVEGDANWLAGSWERGNFMLGGAGPGLNAMVYLEDGIMVVVLANMDPPIASDLAVKLLEATRR